MIYINIRIVTYSFITDDKKGRRMGGRDGIGWYETWTETIMSIVNYIEVVTHIVLINLVIQYFRPIS